jgi:hypothetical protein
MAAAATRWRPRLDALTLGTAAIVLVVGVFYFWTAGSSPDPGRSYHSYLAESFAHGRTSLPIEPAPELATLEDPYDPAQNEPYRQHDASYYDGRYYLYFGPAPAALIFLPARAVGIDLGDRVAAPLLATGGFAAAAILLLFLIRRFVPGTATGWRLVAVAALGLCNVVPFMLRRPAVYETAIAAGFFFLMLAVLLLVVATLRDPPSLPLAVAGSLVLGLAVGARANMALAAPILIWSWWRIAGPRATWRGRGRHLATIAVAIAAPFAACLLLLALYNVVRFGSPTEFGVSYQLTSLSNAREADYFSLARFVPGLWFYLAQPPHLGLDFPFITLRPDYPGTLPEGFYVEPVAGIFVVTPLLAALAALPFLAWRGRDPQARGLGEVGLVLVAAAVLLPLPSLLSFGGATERYEVDFLTLLLIPATLVWLWAAQRLSGRRLARGGVLAAGLATIVVSVATNLAFSVVGYGDGLRTAQPGTYERLERAFGWLPTLAARIAGEPKLLEIRPPPGISVAASEIQLAAPGRGVVDLRAQLLPNPGLPPGSALLADVSQPDGSTSRVALPADEAVPLEVVAERGLNTVTLRWRGVRAPGARPEDLPPAGFGLSGVSIEAWRPE